MVDIGLVFWYYIHSETKRGNIMINFEQIQTTTEIMDEFNAKATEMLMEAITEDDEFENEDDAGDLREIAVQIIFQLAKVFEEEA